MLLLTELQDFIGSNLYPYLSCIGHSVIPIGRAIYYDQHKLKQTLEGTNVVINLAGASINHRWSKSYQHEIYSSRVDVTRQLVKAINSLSHKPELLISASAVGFYDSQGIHNEYNHRQGKGFLPALCPGLGSRGKPSILRYPAGHHPVWRRIFL